VGPEKASHEKASHIEAPEKASHGSTGFARPDESPTISSTPVGITGFARPDESTRDQAAPEKASHVEAPEKASHVETVSDKTRKNDIAETGSIKRQRVEGQVRPGEEANREDRERKATKSDDADVPTGLWYDHLCKEDVRKWSAVDRARIPNTVKTIQLSMLMFWKEKVASSFVDWMKKKHPSIKEIDRSYGKLESFREGRYGWANEGRGQIEYRKWWTDRLMAGGQDRAAGAEAVARAANASWWDWDDGSPAFHWRWPEEYQDWIRDGLPIHFRCEPPRYRKEQ
jgi:hypothetical protein